MVLMTNRIRAKISDPNLFEGLAIKRTQLSFSHLFIFFLLNPNWITLFFYAHSVKDNQTPRLRSVFQSPEIGTRW